MASSDQPSPPWKRELIAKRRARSNAQEESKIEVQTVAGTVPRDRGATEVSPSKKSPPSIMLAGRNESRPLSLTTNTSPSGRWNSHAPGTNNLPFTGRVSSSSTARASGGTHPPQLVTSTTHSSDPITMVEDKRSREPLINFQPQKTILSPTLASLARYNECGGDEELAYGPGIVKKLKSRFLSRTLREKSTENSRPSLRRAASLEDWLDLDKDTVVTSDPVPSQSHYPTIASSSAGTTPTTPSASAFEPQPPPVASIPNDSNYFLKKTRSVDSLGGLTRRSVSVSDLLSPTSRAPRPESLVKEDIVIIERPAKKESVSATVETKAACAAASATKTRRVLPTTTLYGVEDGELPAPDTVKQVKRIFEPGSGRRSSNRRIQATGSDNSISNSSNTASKPNYKSSVARMNEANSQNAEVQPAKPNPNPIPLELQVETPKIFDLAPVPLQTTSKPIPLTPKPNVVRPSTRPRPPIPEVPASELSKTADSVDGEGIRIITKSAMDNIRNESVSTQFNFNNQSKTETKLVTNVSSAPAAKQVGIIRPITFQPVKETPAEIVINKPSVNTPKAGNNVNKSKPKVHEVAPTKAAPGPESIQPLKVSFKDGTTPRTVKIEQGNNETQTATRSVAKAAMKTEQKPVVNGIAEKKSGKASQVQPGSSSMVFNFVDKNETPSHIKDEGSAPCPMKFKHNDSGIVFISTSGESDDSRFVEDEDDVRASDPDFIRRPPSPCNVSFINDNIVIKGKSALQRKPKSKKFNISFSEELTLLFEYPSEASMLEDDTGATATAGGLASYTPSRLQLAASFELGVSKNPSSITPPPAPQSLTEAEDCLRPAEEGTVWSAEYSSDMLF